MSLLAIDVPSCLISGTLTLNPTFEPAWQEGGVAPAAASRPFRPLAFRGMAVASSRRYYDDAIVASGHYDHPVVRNSNEKDNTLQQHPAYDVPAIALKGQHVWEKGIQHVSTQDRSTNNLLEEDEYGV